MLRININMKLTEKYIRRVVRQKIKSRLISEMFDDLKHPKQKGKPFSKPWYETRNGGCIEWYKMYFTDGTHENTGRYISKIKSCEKISAESKKAAAKPRERELYSKSQSHLANPKRNQIGVSSVDIDFYTDLFEKYLQQMKDSQAFKKIHKYTRKICNWLGGQIVEFLSFESIANMIKMKYYGKAAVAVANKVISALPQARGIKLALKGIKFAKAAWAWMSGPIAKFFAKIAIGKGVSKLVFSKIAKKLDKVLGVNNPVTIWKNRLNDFIAKVKTAVYDAGSSLIGYGSETKVEEYCRKKHPRGSPSTIKQCLKSPLPKGI